MAGVNAALIGTPFSVLNFFSWALHRALSPRSRRIIPSRLRKGEDLPKCLTIYDWSHIRFSGRRGVSGASVIDVESSTGEADAY